MRGIPVRRNQVWVGVLVEIGGPTEPGVE